MPLNGDVRMLPDIQERAARVLAAVLLMGPESERIDRELKRLVSEYGIASAIAIALRAIELAEHRTTSD